MGKYLVWKCPGECSRGKISSGGGGDILGGGGPVGKCPGGMSRGNCPRRDVLGGMSRGKCPGGGCPVGNVLYYFNHKV